MLPAVDYAQLNPSVFGKNLADKRGGFDELWAGSYQ
jgi:hypothetical protein